MVNLKFNDDFTDIIEEPIKYWRRIDDVPKIIKEFIMNNVSSRIIYDSSTKQYYCSKCTKKLNEDYYCSMCCKQYKIPSIGRTKYIINTDISNIKTFNETTNYYVFDYFDKYVLLYSFNVYSSYNTSMMSVPYQINKITIGEVYSINEDGIINIINNKFLSFKQYDKSMDDENFDFDLLDVFENTSNIHFLYIDNLIGLRNTSLYKYTNIWELKEYYKNENFSLSSLTYFPIHFKQFEYLVKMKLYCLAVTCPNLIKYKGSFEKTFEVDRKYYSFMKDIDINYSQLEALKIYPTTDINLINFIANDVFLFKKISKYVRLDKLKKYLEKQNLDYHSIYEYYDYIRCCERMGFNLKNKSILFPKNFILEHNRLTSELVIATDPEIDKKIKSLSSILKLNIYEDDEYVIFPADSVKALINESSQMSNCVRNYCEYISNNECQIYFLRSKNNIKKSLVTIEVRNGKIVQAKMKFNKLPNDELNKILKKFERKMIPVFKN